MSSALELLPAAIDDRRRSEDSRAQFLTAQGRRTKFKGGDLGAVAQLGERVVRNDEVRGSIPLGSTIPSCAQPPRKACALVSVRSFRFHLNQFSDDCSLQKRNAAAPRLRTRTSPGGTAATGCRDTRNFIPGASWTKQQKDCHKGNARSIAMRLPEIFLALGIFQNDAGQRHADEVRQKPQS